MWTGSSDWAGSAAHLGVYLYLGVFTNYIKLSFKICNCLTSGAGVTAVGKAGGEMFVVVRAPCCCVTLVTPQLGPSLALLV